MKLKKQIFLFCLILIIQLAFDNLFSQSVQTKPTRQSSFEAFSQGNYEKAYTQFRELLITYSKDPLYKYYSGVCLIKLNRDPGEATTLLSEAIQGSGSVKTLPSDGLFYLGRAQQMSGKFTEAAESYNLYTKQVGKKTAKEMGVPEFIQQCIEKKGEVSDSHPKAAMSIKNDKPDSSKKEAKSSINESINKTPENVAATKVNLPASYEKILAEAIEFQFKADSVTSIVSGQKKQLDKLTGNDKFALKLRMNVNEKTAASFQSSADQKYHEAQLMNPKADTTIKLKDVARQAEYKVVKDSAKRIDSRIVKAADKKSDTAKVILPPVKTQMEIFSFFEALPKSGSDPNAKIVIDPEVPPGLIYRIQIAVFRNPVVPSYFRGLSPIYGFKIEGTDKIIYYAGMFRKSSDANKALSAVKSKGFKDAFIIALLANKRVSADRAVVLEKEWGGKPFYSINKTLPETKTDTITRTLTFRVEVIRSLKPLTEDVVEGIRKMAGNRGLDIKLLEDGKIDYLVGKFITFETASEYAGLLNRNGFREAKVVAKLGEKEIPVETARQLFEKLK